MEIEINNFKCYPKATFKFPSSGITLLKGQSGMGKSTILQAMTWCLYGNIRGVDSNTGSKRGKLNVSIKTNIGGKDCQIYRQKRPNLLKFKAGGLEQVDDVAQARIYEMFGSEEMWKLCCYLEQSLTNPLFRVSSSEKMSLLNKVAFAESDPTVYIHKIEEMLKEENIRFEILQQTFQKECDDFKDFIDSQKIKPEDGRTEEEMEELMSTKSQLNNEIISMRERQFSHHQSSTTIDLVGKRIEEINIRLDKIGDVSGAEEKISQIRRISEVLRQFQTFQDGLDRVSEELSDIKESLENYEDIEVATTEFFYETQNLQNQFSLQLSKAKSIGIEYNPEAIAKKKEFLKCIFKIQPALKLHRQISQIYEQITALPEIDVDEAKIKAQEEQVYELKRGGNVMLCPKCSQSLLYKDSNLIESDHAPSTKEELGEAVEILKEMKKKYEVHTQRKTLVDQFEKLKAMYTEEITGVTQEEIEVLGEYSSKHLTGEELGEFQRKQSHIHSIEIIEPPDADLDEIRKGVKKGKLLESRERTEEELSQLRISQEEFKENCEGKTPEELDDLDQNLQNLIHLVRSESELKDALEKCEALKSEHLTRLDPEIDSKISKIEEKLESLRDNIEKARVTNEAVRRQASLKQHRSGIVEKSQKVYHLERLKNIAIEVECKVLQQTVDSINSTINVLAESIFEDPIRVELKLYRQLKSKKTIKPGVNIEIRSKGGVYDSPNEMSGGEKDRLSLLLTLALNRLSGAPLMMLDEVFSSLDETTKEHCLRAVRSATIGKNVICVDHNGVEGYYEHVIDMGQ